jgi:uncharacterized membrane protein YtjA (UPF0391 family)
MLKWTAVFLVIAIVAAALGFSGLVDGGAWLAKVVFVLFAVLFILSLIFRTRPPIG